ncbi:MAG: MFS transporter [Candidatus Thermoplasmatota archaeon]|nr:MFS transporter [Candidatus Thermoplasmatota archaeon]
MSDVLEAELAPSGSLKTGWFDLGKKDRFRDIWVVIFYLGLMLPYAFVGLWIGKVANNEFHLPIKDIALAIMLLKIPFFLRLIWAQPVEKFVHLPFGRRRSWILIGTFVHIVLVIPLLFIDIRTATWLFVGIMFVALIPRLFAEQAVAGMMAESVPKLGRFNSGINLAYRGGGHILLLLMGWLTSTTSPFAEGDVLNWNTIQMVGLITAIVTSLFAVAITVVMKEGTAIRGPSSTKKKRVAKTMQDAIDNPELEFPDDSSTMNRILAAMRTRTAWIVLLICFLMPLGDGFEGMFAFYLRDVLAFDASKAIMWANITIFATYLGLLGPWLSDYYGRTKILRLSAIGSVACYAGLGIMMLIGAPEIALLLLWMPTLTITDWLIFTFITAWAEVSDPRLGPTHMALYQTTHAVASTFVWFGLGVFLIYATNGAYWLIFMLACLGPLFGLSQFHKLKLGDEYGTDRLDVTEKVRHWQNKLAGLPWGVEPIDKSSRRRLAMTTGIVGLLISTMLFAGPMVLLNWESSETEEHWNLKGWNETEITFETFQSIGTGGNVMATVDVPNTEGGIYEALFRVTRGQDNCGGAAATWSTTFSMPDRGNLSDGSNETNFQNLDSWEGEMGIDFDAEAPNLTSYPSEEALLGELQSISREVWWGHGRGTWTLKVEMSETECLGGLGAVHQIDFTVNITVKHLIIPSTSPENGMVDVSSIVTTEQHDYGQAVGVLLGFPILLATPILAWIAGRDPDTMLT